MIENLKNILLIKLNKEVEDYNDIKLKYDEMAEKIKNDNSDYEYNQKKKKLKKSFGLKRFFKAKEYKSKLQEIEKDYENNLKEFRDFYDEYNRVKTKLSKWNIYGIKKQIESIPNYKALKEFRMSKAKIISLLEENNLYDTLTDEELKKLEKLR